MDQNQDQSGVSCPCCGARYEPEQHPEHVERIRAWQSGSAAAAALGKLSAGKPRKQSAKAKRNRQAHMAKVNAAKAKLWEEKSRITGKVQKMEQAKAAIESAGFKVSKLLAKALEGEL